MGKDDEKPFYLQLNESIYERVQKEKAEQIKIQSLQQRTARGQFFATVFGTNPSYTSTAAHTND
jgi:D-lactate dehydrogenase (cytochrome)